MPDKRLLMTSRQAQFTLKYTYLGQECRNVLYGHISNDEDAASWDNDAMETFGANLVESWGARYAPLAAEGVTLYGCDYVTNTDPGAGPLIGGTVTTGGLPIDGGEPSDGCANNVTLAIKLGTAVLGRSGHGRFYFVGINAGLYNATTPNVLKSGAVADFHTANDAFLADNTAVAISTGVTARLCVVSFVSGGVDRDVAIQNDVTSISLTDNTFDLQRRRLPGRGI
jgi:hypothetical protein